MTSLFLLAGILCGQVTEDAKISSPTKDEAGVLTYDVESVYQAGVTKIRVLQPMQMAADGRIPIVFVLPVEAGDENRYGNGLDEIRKLDLHNKRPAIYIAPTFSHLPWYADHPTDKTIRQESYFLKVLQLFVDANIPMSAERERLLLGFSKSGWGAWSLLLRHPDRFQRAAAWDAPLMMDRPGKYGSGEIFGTDENFAAYRLSELIPKRADDLKKRPRLILTGYGNFRSEHERMHALLDEQKIPHVYRDGPQFKHHWGGGWVEEAVELLLKREEK